MSPNNFTHVAFTAGSLDRYLIRTSIFEAIKSSLINFKGNLLHVGCGKMPYKNVILKNSSVEKYIGLDIESAIQYDAKVKPDFTWDGIKMSFDDASFDFTFATVVLEYCPEPEIILNEIYRVMKHDGCFFFTVPFLWNLHEVPHDDTEKS
ncbi:MAG: class I SAM-dependent methyltransferase [Ginsengibacter sp.]